MPRRLRAVPRGARRQRRDEKSSCQCQPAQCDYSSYRLRSHVFSSLDCVIPRLAIQREIAAHRFTSCGEWASNHSQGSRGPRFESPDGGARLTEERDARFMEHEELPVELTLILTWEMPQITVNCEDVNHE